MRVIKFRAWDKKNNRMIDGWDLEYLNEVFESKKDGLFVIGDDLEVMQYTGAKDKNGVDIYEGDICENGDYEEDAHGYNTWIEVVRWDEESTGFLGLYSNEHGMKCEVIGNIHENEELIK